MVIVPWIAEVPLYMQIGLGLSVIFTFLIVSLLVFQLVVGEETTSVKARVERLSTVPEELKNELPTDFGGVVETKKSLLSAIDLRPLLSKFTGENYFNRMEMELTQADIPLRVSEFLIMRGIIGLLLGLVTLLFTKNIAISFPVMLIAFFAHVPFMSMRKKGRINKFNNQLSEFLILVVNSIRAGQTFMQGADVAAAESPEPIAGEFKQVIKEVNLGMSSEQSLDNLLIRVPSEDLKIVVAAYSIQRKVGGNLAAILETTAATIRERLRIQGQINTLTTQGKLSGVIVALAPFVIGGILSLMMPEMMFNFVNSFAGKVAIGIALTMQTIGALAIKKIVSIEI